MSNEFTVASFNAHWGVGRFGAYAGIRFDLAATVRGFDADVVVVAESWRHLDGAGVLDPLRDDGYTVDAEPMLNLRLRADGHGVATDPGHGTWELAICSRLPVLVRRKVPIGIVTRDPARLRYALAYTIDVGGTPVEVIGVHVSSKLWYAGPVRHLLALRRQLPGRDRPAVLAGDFNLWGPPVRALLPGWRRAVRGRTYPVYAPHSQIDHVLVNAGIDTLGGEVLAATPSDHRPIRARLRVRG